MRSNLLITPPALEPVTLAEVKTHLRLPADATEDTYLNSLITSARQYCEQETRRAFINQTWELSLDGWGGSGKDEWWDGVREGSIDLFTGSADVIELPLLPIVSITSLTTYNEADEPTLVNASTYLLDRVHGRLMKKNLVTWPTNLRNHQSVVVRYVAGYGPAAVDVPMALRMAILQLISHWYENREYVVANGLQPVSIALHVTATLRKYKAARL